MTIASSVSTTNPSSIWNCPGIDSGPNFFWCGNETAVRPCQSHSNVPKIQTVQDWAQYAEASVLGHPSMTSAQVANPTTAGIYNSLTATTSVESLPGLRTSITILSTLTASTSASAPSRTPSHGTPTSTTIGASIGVPLGAMMVGLLGLLFWRQSRQNRIGQKERLGSDDNLQQGRTSACTVKRGSRQELRDIQIPWQADDSACKNEMPVYT